MLGHSHAATGAAVVVLVAPHQPWPILAATAAVGAAAALLPDIDIESSTVSNSLGPVTRLVSRVVAWIADGHRGGTHGLLALALVTYASWAMHAPQPYVRAVIYGYVSHLIADYLTGPGVPWFWPLVRRRFRLPILGRTGGWREHAAVGSLVLVAVMAL